MEDKVFELMTKMYSEISAKLEDIDKKLDNKADKHDIVRIETNIIKNVTEKIDVWGY